MCCSTRHHPSRAPQACRAQKNHVQADGFFVPGRRTAVLRAARKRRGEHGSAILESFLSMLLLGLILFGVLQLFQLALAQMVADYAAFRGARSAAVGLKNEWAYIESLVKAAPASGHLQFEDHRRPSLYQEEAILEKFMYQKKGYEHVNYSYWDGDVQFHTDYRCPDYGLPMRGGCSICRLSKKPRAELSVGGFDIKHTEFQFINYPLTIPFYKFITGHESVTITGEANVANYSERILE